jgi:hydroxyatrazine ethylaminohydrolase
VAWCEQQGFCGPDVWVAHGWEFDASDIATLAASHTGVAHCPAPVFLVGERITDLAGMAAAGVRIGLGVDGQASNDASNLLECVRTGYLLQALAAGLHDRPNPEPAAFLRYATAGGADLLGCPELGILAMGQAADFFCVDVGGLEYVGALHDPMSLPAKVGVGAFAAMTVIDGRVVWREGEFPGLDETRLVREAEAAHAALAIEL